jgi:hypothetical protein
MGLPTVRGTARSPKSIEIITPAGRIHRFPKVPLYHRLVATIFSNSETVIVSITICAMVYLVSILAELIEPLSASNCIS